MTTSEAANDVAAENGSSGSGCMDISDVPIFWRRAMKKYFMRLLNW